MSITRPSTSTSISFHQPCLNKYILSYLHSLPYPSEIHNYSKHHFLYSQWLFWIGGISTPISLNSPCFGFVFFPLNILKSLVMGTKLSQWVRLNVWFKMGALEPSHLPWGIQSHLQRKTPSTFPLCFVTYWWKTEVKYWYLMYTRKSK